MSMQKATETFWPDAHRDPEKMAKLAIAGFEIGGIECVKIPFDNVVEAEALGCKTKYPESIHLHPLTQDNPYSKPSDLSIPEKLLDMGRIPIVLEAIGIARRKVGDHLPICSHATGPFTLACALVGLKPFIVWSLRKPEYVKTFLDIATDVIVDYAKAQYRAGSDVVTIVDGGFSPDLVPPSALHEFIEPALVHISRSLGGVRLLYIGGNVGSMVPFLMNCGYDGVSVDEEVNIREIKSALVNVKILGNVSSNAVLASGSPLQVKAAVKKAIEDGADLIEPSYGIPPETPTENITAMVEAAREFVKPPE